MSDPAVIGPGGRERRSRPLLRTMLGNVLRRSRLDQGRTLAEVARAAKVSMPYLSELERGRKEASSEVLAAICDALRIELGGVLEEVGRDLAQDRAHHASVIRLESMSLHSHRVAPRQPGAGDVVCLLAA